MVNERPEERAAKLLREQGLTLAIAESCTGGLLGDRLTDVPGSSDYFLGGIISYSNEAKEQVLGVLHETLLRYGAVSENTAREMARNARRHFRSELGISITGIAGPTGGAPEKPVGLTYIALASASEERCERHVWEGDRRPNKEQSAEAALQLLIKHLEQ